MRQRLNDYVRGSSELQARTAVSTTVGKCEPRTQASSRANCGVVNRRESIDRMPQRAARLAAIGSARGYLSSRPVTSPWNGDSDRVRSPIATAPP
jgi:hypothetical protein